ncbi:MAG: carboxypeptidase regulatory-like domain-containing protein [Planctomycetes bacterium]|nr:carboxypeptidase regulatory-like domain-containing protein [Planctomycetota bacterium]
MNSFSRQVCVLICFFLSMAAVGQNSNHKFHYTATVVDINGRPVSDAEVAVLEVIFDYADGQKRMELIEKKKTDSSGNTVLNLDFSKHRDIFIVVHKKPLAVTWDRLNSRNLPVDGSQLTMLLDTPCILAGIVVDRLGRPVVGARLRMELDCHSLENKHRINAPEDWLTVETDGDGRFYFANIPPDGSADFLVTAPGKANVYTFMASDSMPGFRHAAGWSDIRIVLPDEAKIQGRVLDPSGKPVAGVRLLARADKGVANYYSTNRAVSGEDGRFLFENVLADTYSLQVVVQEDRMADWVGRDVKVIAKEGQTTDGFIIRVNKGGLVEVDILDATTYQPAENVWVSITKKSAYSMHPCFTQSMRTDRNGKALFRAPLGQCDITAGYGEYSQYNNKIVVKHTPTKGKILLEHCPEITGAVHDIAGRAVPGALVTIIPPSTTVRTDANGNFHINWLVVGKKANLLARDEQRNLAGMSEIKDRNRPVNIVLKPALTLAGQITNPNGQPIPVARIQLVTLLQNWQVRIGNELMTDTNGHFEISAVPPFLKEDMYRIKVNASGYCPVRFDGISLGEASSLSPFVLHPLNMSISGVVVDAEDRLIPNKAVTLGGPDGGQGQPKKGTMTDTDGRFFFNRISKGPLRLQAGWGSDDDEGFLDAQAGDKDVKIVLGQKRVHTGGSSLVGKALPELGQFGLESASEAAGKKILICFWDMNQEPTRNFVQKLNTREKLLAEEGVDTVLVYAGQIVDSWLSDWLKKNGITIICGKYDGDIAVLGRTWAVQSLPWLILTNRNHIVTGEGFSLAELNDKIKQQ